MPLTKTVHGIARVVLTRGASGPMTMLALCGMVTGCGGSKEPAPEALAYSTPSALYTQGVSIAANVPAVKNRVTSWNANPALPTGLALNAVTGVISGTPAEVQGGTTHTITAANSSGSTTAVLSIAVKSGGHHSAKLVHFYNSAAWGAVNIYFSSDGGAWPTSSGVAMASEGGNWFGHTIPACDVTEFSFNDGSTWLPSQAGNNFRNSWAEVWIKDGLLFTYNPEAGTEPSSELSILTLNLHTYQELLEPDGGTQADKLDRIADTIAAIDADFVCLQECAQSASASVISDTRAHLSASGAEFLKADNMAYLLSRRLKDTYGLTYGYAWSWAHYGFSVYEEGVAILTKHPIDSYDNAYISTSTSPGNPLGSRKAIHLSSTLPGGKVVNVFSAHVSFAGPEQDRQLDTLRLWMAGKEVNGAVASVVGGDFNMDQGSPGYLRMTSTVGGAPYIDSYWFANPEGYGDSTIQGGQRIDYVFFKNGNRLVPLTGQTYFKIGNSYLGSRVSDHNGTILRLKLTN